MVLHVISPDASCRSPRAATPSQSPWSTRQLTAAAIVLVLLAAAVLSADLAIAAYFRSHPLPGDFARLVRLSETFAWGGTVALIILTTVALDARGWRTLPTLAVGAFGAGLLADGLKLFVARLRPGAAVEIGATETFLAWLPLFHRDSLGQSYGHAVQSFPSAHAATAVGLAIALTMLYPRGRWLFVALAALACFQRIEAQAHFASDVLAGAAIGCAVGAACRWHSDSRRQSIGGKPAAA